MSIDFYKLIFFNKSIAFCEPTFCYSFTSFYKAIRLYSLIKSHKFIRGHKFIINLPLNLLGMSRHLMQIEVRFASSLWQMVHLTYLQFATQIVGRSSKKHCLSTVLSFYYIVYLIVLYKLPISYILFVPQGFDWI